MNNRWLKKNTFYYSQFGDLERLVEMKRQRDVTISLCLPTLNEEKTIAKEIIIMNSELMTRHPLIDEIIVVDSGSEDRTLEIAAQYGAEVYTATDILPDLGDFRGKGENLWKALYVTRGDIIVYLDADIKNVHHRFVYALVGPLLAYDHIKYCKAFYDRPIAVGDRKLRPTGGGRVTELVVRPLFSLFFPELTQLIQPLSGEYAGYRDIFDKIPFPIGYGIETSMILDISEKWGLDVIAQVDLDRRIHRNQSTKALGKMAFVIIQTFLKRIADRGHIDIHGKLFDEMLQYALEGDDYYPEIYKIAGHERPPMIDIPTYRDKFGLAQQLKDVP